MNHGATISHPYMRNIVMTGGNPGLEGDALARALTPDQLDKLKDTIARALDHGAVGIGFGLAYSPGATSDERLEPGAAPHAGQVGAVTISKSKPRLSARCSNGL